MNVRKFRYFVGDFETTVYKGQVNTEVWASASVEMFTDEVKVFNSIGEQFQYFTDLNDNIIVYYHNLKFDGSFWLSYLLVDLGFEQAYNQDSETVDSIHWIPHKDMRNNTVSYSISDMGQWYRITVKVHNHIIEFRDSLKLLPFSVNRIGSSFATKHKKLDMEYKGFRYAGCNITDEEREYIANDVLVVKEALEIMFTEGHKKLTIGSCCLAEYRKLIGGRVYDKYFPDIYQIPLDENVYGSPNAGEYIRKSYRGGWCYVARGKEKKLKRNGTTADVNSLYPSMMSSESMNRYPIGKPTFWVGDIPDEALSPTKYYFVRIRTQFYIKKNMLPFIQIKNDLMYNAREHLETSDILNSQTGEYTNKFIDFDGTIKDASVELTVTMTDYKLIQEHYKLVNLEVLDGCYFDSAIGIFDTYIEKYKKIKLESKGAKRELAKLFLNNLYGKMASSQDSSFKVAYIKEDKSLGFFAVTAKDKKAGYIPVGSAITSYARNFTIRAAQKNYHGVNKRGFIYADTDSIHCDLLPDEIQGITVHPKNFCCWKLESCWDTGYFVRPKTYIEHVTHEDCEPIDNPYYNVKCAGMPDRCKDLFIKTMVGFTDEEVKDYSDEAKSFLYTDKDNTKHRTNTIEDFDIGLAIPCKLMPKRIRGGVLLVDTVYQMR